MLKFSMMMWSSTGEYWNITFTTLLRNFAKGQKKQKQSKT